MKHKILIGLLFLVGVVGVALLPGCGDASGEGKLGAWSADVTVDSVGVWRIGENVTITDEGIRRLASSGRICEVFGHWWEDVDGLYRPGADADSAVPREWQRRHVCRLCGHEEVLHERWEEVR